MQLPKLVEPVIREAAALAGSHFGQKIRLEMKGDNSYVTEADIACENYLIKELSKLLPTAAIWAEESGKSSQGEYHWVIDPIDGTTNFYHGIPYYCISVALTQDNVPIFGMIYQPLQDELFWAIKGAGAHLNNKKISVADNKPLKDTFLVLSTSYPQHEQSMQLLHKLDKIMPAAFATRHMGAAALDQAYVACGRFDAVFFPDLYWWDIAAGKLLIEEAGGQVTQFDGSPVTPLYQTFIGGNPDTCERIREIINS